MTPQELDGCYRLLAAYWPGEWDTERLAVWTIELAALEPAAARNALVEMGRTERWPSVAAFVAIAAANTRKEATANGARFMPGTGWVHLYDPDAREAQQQAAREAQQRTATKHEPISPEQAARFAELRKAMRCDDTSTHDDQQ